MAIPTGFSTVNPFMITDDADGLMRFITAVFGAVERPEARTVDTDGLLLQGELQLGNTTIMLADRKPDWPFTPAFVQVYVDDVEATLAKAVELGGEIYTQPTDFFGQTFSRMKDAWQNVWWVYSTPADGEEEAWEEDADWSEGDTEEWEQTPELQYINETMHKVFTSVVDPRGRS